MSYEFRWWNALLASAMMICFVFFYDIRPKWQAHQVLNEKKVALQKEIVAKKKKVSEEKKANRQISFSNLDKKNQETHALSLIAEAMHLQGLSLQKAVKKTSVAKTYKNIIIFRVTIIGNFKQIYAFVMTLLNYSDCLAFLNFSYQKNTQQQFVFAADIAFFHPKKMEMIIPFRDEHSKKWVDPFRSSDDFSMSLNDQTSVKGSIFQMKMIGFLKLASRQEAWLLLPNHHLLSVKTGDVIGKEHARIIHLSRDEIVMLLSNRKQYVLKK